MISVPRLAFALTLPIALIALSGPSFADGNPHLLCTSVEDTEFEMLIWTNEDYRSGDPVPGFGRDIQMGYNSPPLGLDVEVVKSFGTTRQKRMKYGRKGVGHLAAGTINLYLPDAPTNDPRFQVGKLILESCKFRSCAGGPLPDFRAEYQEGSLPGVEMTCSLRKRREGKIPTLTL